MKASESVVVVFTLMPCPRPSGDSRLPIAYLGGTHEEDKCQGLELILERAYQPWRGPIYCLKPTTDRNPDLQLVVSLAVADQRPPHVLVAIDEIDGQAKESGSPLIICNWYVQCV